MKKLKKVLKIKPRVKNINYNAPTGQTPKSGIGKKKMASFRKTDAEMKKLQQETKDPNRTTVSYKRVTSKNKSKFSDQQKVKSKETTKKKKTGTRTPAGMVRVKGGRLVSTRTAQGMKAMNKLKARKRAQEMAKKRLGK
jgi:hypothetical protein